MGCYVFLSDESLLTWHHYNTFDVNRFNLQQKAPGFWMVEHHFFT